MLSAESFMASGNLSLNLRSEARFPVLQRWSSRRTNSRCVSGGRGGGVATVDVVATVVLAASVVSLALLPELSQEQRTSAAATARDVRCVIRIPDVLCPLRP